MKTLSISEAKAKFSEVVDCVLEGREVIVTRMGAPVVKVVMYHPAHENKRLGSFRGQLKISPDFDTWPDEEAELLGLK